MNILLLKADEIHKEVLQNLMQLYMYDFSTYTGGDVEYNGLYAPYPHLDDYWSEPHHRFPYMIMNDDKYIGFVLVRFIETEALHYFSIGEFFIMKKYRRTGIGSAIAMQVFDMHKGQWQVYQMANNKPAQLFWRAVIAAYTKGQFVERTEKSRLIQEFENGTGKP